ncbi:major facilitator superfamily domain-containing protein [Kockiozyma suomiensis]|uniref:major facilitator superfamily domain-containing protein n=1 Tax=Kockiozyma suomiensis TaxID=1337062 RepID=UPI00334328D8
MVAEANSFQSEPEDMSDSDSVDIVNSYSNSVEHEQEMKDIEKLSDNEPEHDQNKQSPQQKANGPSFLSDLDHSIVGWDSEEDLANPKNWATRQKLCVMFFVFITGLMVPTVSTLFAPGQALMASEFGLTNSVVMQFTVSAYVLGFGWGPLIHAPMSEMYGRKYVIAISNLLLALLNVGCSEASSVPIFLVFRTLSGILGCAGMVVGAGIISDMFRAQETGRATAIYLLGPIMGPVFGPILGGFISQRAGWRWCFRVIEIFAVIMALCFFLAVEETNPAVLLRRKAKRLASELKRPELVSIIDSRVPPMKPLRKFTANITRAFRLMLFSPIVVAFSLYMTVAYSYLYVFFTTLTDVLTMQYGWSIEMAGLAYLSVGFGTFTSVMVVGSTNDRMVQYLTKKNDGVRKPEMRLRPMIVGSILLPACMFWYGWAVQDHIHWFPLILSMFPMGAGLIASLLPIQAYLIELYAPLGAAASATAALNLLRSTAAALIPLCVPSLIGSLGYGWGYSLLGFLAILFCTATSFLFVKWGEKLRERFPPKI